ncbi:MFS transporter [Solidesulfovibrio sp.]|uniref:MFS transporter n=1 Tax=Solidesulfovibrio sp. TaxID=2910990 RepID=UPI00262FABB3|nr:MFS transporter [Solidesulfovibrio sp.]
MKKDWWIIWVTFAVGVIASFVQCSVTPLLPVLQDRFQLSYANAGMLMTLFALAALVFATPCGLVIQRCGVRRVGLWGLLLLCCGLGLILLATCHSLYPVFLAGRIIQGVGFALVAVAAPSAIGQFVSKPLLPLAMGIWSTWIPCGSLLMFFAAPRLLDHYSLSAYWLFLLLLVCPGIAAYALVIPSHRQSGLAEAALPSRQAILDELGNAKVWFAAVAFAAYTFGFFSLVTWITTYLSENMGQSLLQAADASILYWPFSILSNIYGGFFLKRFGRSRLLFVLPPAGLAVLWPLFAIPSLETFYAVLVAMGLIAGIVPTIIFASGPMLAKRPEGIGVAMAVIIIGENLGILIGPEVFGILRQLSGGFTLGFSALSLGALLQILMLYKIWKTGVFDRPRPAGERAD